MKSIELLEKLKQKPVFRVQDIERITGCNRSYAWLILSRLLKHRLIKKIMRNAYTTKSDIFLIASNIASPSYISFWSASYYLGFTEQIVNTIFVATTRKIKSIKFENYAIEFVPIKAFFGFRKIKTNEGEIFIVDNEKLLIDAFIKPKKCGNFDEIMKMFSESKVSKEKIVGYLKQENNKILMKRVGYLLEKMQNIDMSKSLNLDKNYITLNPFSNKWKHINKKWKVKLC